MHNFTALFLSLMSISAFSMPVLHLFKPHSNFTQVVTQDTCAFFSLRRDSVGCNPALFAKDAREGLTFSVGSKSDGESVETGRKLIFDSIKKEFLEELFEDNNFNSWGGGTYLEFNTPYFYLSYDPIHVTADIFVSNPAFPEVSMSLHNVKRLGVTSGIKLDALSNKNNSLFIGGTLFYFEHSYYQDNFSLFELTSSSVDNLIKFKSGNSIAADLSLTYINDIFLIPNVAFIIKNLNSHYDISEEKVLSEKELQPLLNYENYSRVNLGYDFKFKFGSLNTEVSMPFDGLYENYYNEYVSFGIGYSLGNFNTSASYSKYITNFGFKFESDSSSVGIYYSAIQALGDFSSKVENTAGFVFEVYL